MPRSNSPSTSSYKSHSKETTHDRKNPRRLRRCADKNSSPAIGRHCHLRTNSSDRVECGVHLLSRSSMTAFVHVRRQTPSLNHECTGVGEGCRGSCRSKFSARPSIALRRAHVRGRDGRIIGQAAVVAHHCGNPLFSGSLLTFTCIIFL